MTFKRSIIVTLVLINLIGVVVFVSRKVDKKLSTSSKEIPPWLINHLNKGKDKQNWESVTPDGLTANEQREGAPLTPNLVRLSLKNYDKSCNDAHGRNLLLGDFVKELCKNGYANEAFDLIVPGYGDMRKEQLKSFFNLAQIDQDQMVGFLKKCEMKEDLSSALFGYFTRLSPEDLVSVMSRPDMAQILAGAEKVGETTNVSSWLSAGLQAAKFKHNSDDSVVTGAVMNLYSEGHLKPSDVMIIAKYNDPKDIFKKWDQLKSLTSADEQEQKGLREKRELMISTMITADRANAMKQILANDGDDAQNFKDVQAAIRSGLRGDAQGIAGWYKSNKSDFTQKQQSMVAASFAKEAGEAGEFDVARQWAEQIEDPEGRTAILKIIDEHQGPKK